MPCAPSGSPQSVSINEPTRLLCAKLRSRDPSIYRNAYGSRRDSVSHNNELTGTPLLSSRYIEMSRHQIVGGNRHAAVIVCPTVKHMTGPIIRNAHKGI